MERNKEILKKYLPPNAVEPVLMLLNQHKKLQLKISRKRSSKLGDYRILPVNNHQISVNYDLNLYQFLLTLLHEMAHYLTYKKYGRRIKPHGKEWKHIFGNLILEFITYDVFPEDLLEDLKKYASNPKASTSGDGDLYLKLSSYDKNSEDELKYVFELEPNSYFSMENGTVFLLQEKRRTRYKCINIKNRKPYLVHKNAKVIPLKQNDYE